MENITTNNSTYYKMLRSVLRIYKFTGVLLIAGAVLLVGIQYLPELPYEITASDLNEERSNLAETAASLGEVVQSAPTPVPTPVDARPAIDLSLPVEPTLVIAKLGVRAQLHTGESESLLDKGVWHPDYSGNPESVIPMILASHRYGVLSWSKDFRDQNWFYRLPELQTGDQIEVYWGQRRYIYQVTKTFEASDIRQIDADMMLFTCKYLRAKERIVVFANLVNY